MIAIFTTLMFAGLQTTVTGSDMESPKIGTWRAWLESPGGELPFGLEISRAHANWEGWIVNGPERKRIARVSWDPMELVLDIADFDSTIRASSSQNGSRLDGTWRKRSGANKWAELPFHALFGVTDRFPRSVGESPDAANRITGRWTVKFASDEDAAVGVFSADRDGIASGTFLTTTGDYRFLAGVVEGDSLKLSTFDGAHAFLFIAKLKEDDSLVGDFWSRDAFHDTWTAKRDAQAALPDAFTLTKRTDDYDLARMSFPDLDGKLRTLADPAFAGKVRIIEVFGSWCPNCHDASDYLADLHRRLKARGLSVVGLAFELTGDLALDTEQVRTFTSLHNVDYPILIAGVSDREKASDVLPMLDKLRAYPTLIVLDATGKVRAIYTGFSGPASGDDHKTFRIKFESLIEGMLDRP